MIVAGAFAVAASVVPGVAAVASAAVASVAGVIVAGAFAPAEDAAGPSGVAVCVFVRLVGVGDSAVPSIAVAYAIPRSATVSSWFARPLPIFSSARCRLDDGVVLPVVAGGLFLFAVAAVAVFSVPSAAFLAALGEVFPAFVSATLPVFACVLPAVCRVAPDAVFVQSAFEVLLGVFDLIAVVEVPAAGVAAGELDRLA